MLSTTGVGTVLDPRCGRGSPVTPDARENFIESAGEQLRFRLPALEVAVIAAPWADAAGNIYFHDAATITENVEAARAGKQAWYVTTVGAFRLTDGGLVLEIVMPGLDVERDIRPNCGVRFGLPPGGPAEAPASILSGLNYALAWGVGARG